MNDNKAKRFRCIPKVEFLSAHQDILNKLREGYSKRYIYDEFKENGKFTMTYQTFCNYLNSPFQNQKNCSKPVIKHNTYSEVQVPDNSEIQLIDNSNEIYSSKKVIDISNTTGSVPQVIEDKEEGFNKEQKQKDTLI
jgi:hypothetical protein